MSHCSHEAFDNSPTATDWLQRIEGAVDAIAAARNALRQTPNDNGWAQEGQATELKKRTDAYTSAVHHFLTVIRQAHEGHPRVLSAIQEKYKGLLGDAASLFRSAAPGSEQALRAEAVLTELESLESYFRNDQGMTMSTWSDSTGSPKHTRRSQSPEHTREPQSPGNRRLSRPPTHEEAKKSPSPTRVSAQSHSDTLLVIPSRLTLSCSRVSRVLVAWEAQEIVSGCHLHASTP